MHWWEEYKVDVPPGQSGEWRVERFRVSKEDSEADRLRAFVSGSARHVPPGDYTALHRGPTLVMSDTRDEVRDHLRVIQQARGRVLVAGLGLGVVALALAAKDDVDEVTVVERSADVVKLVWSHCLAKRGGEKLRLVEDDVFSWCPPARERWDYAWFDVWDYICSDNLPEMHSLHRKFARRAAWKGSWCRAECEEARRRGV